MSHLTLISKDSPADLMVDNAGVNDSWKLLGWNHCLILSRAFTSANGEANGSYLSFFFISPELRVFTELL